MIAYVFQKYVENFAYQLIHNFAVINQWNLLFSKEVAYSLTVSIAFSVYKQNFTAQ